MGIGKNKNLPKNQKRFTFAGVNYGPIPAYGRQGSMDSPPVGGYQPLDSGSIFYTAILAL